MRTQAQVAEFKAKGFLKSGRVLSDSQLEVLKSELERVIRDRDKGGRQPVLCHNLTKQEKAPVWQVVNILEAIAPFAELVRNRTIAEEAAQLSGIESFLSSSWRRKRQGVEA